MLFDRVELLRLLQESGYADHTGFDEIAEGQTKLAMKRISKWLKDRADVEFSNPTFLRDLELI
jgi:hypothetical protein